jgi:hypothetical protein
MVKTNIDYTPEETAKSVALRRFPSEAPTDDPVQLLKKLVVLMQTQILQLGEIMETLRREIVTRPAARFDMMTYNVTANTEAKLLVNKDANRLTVRITCLGTGSLWIGPKGVTRDTGYKLVATAGANTAIFTDNVGVIYGISDSSTVVSISIE